MRKVMFMIMVSVMVLVPLLIPASAQADTCGTAPSCGIFSAGPGFQAGATLIDMTTVPPTQNLGPFHVWDKCNADPAAGSVPGDAFDYEIITTPIPEGQAINFALPVHAEYICLNDPWFTNTPSATGLYYGQTNYTRERQVTDQLGTFRFKDTRFRTPQTNVPPCNPVTTGVTFDGEITAKDFIATSYYDIPEKWIFTTVPTYANQCSPDWTAQLNTPAYDQYSPRFAIVQAELSGPITGADDAGVAGNIDPLAKAVFNYIAYIDLNNGDINYLGDPPGSIIEFVTNGKLHHPDQMTIEITKDNPADIDGNGVITGTDFTQGFVPGYYGAICAFNPWWYCIN